MTDTWRGPPGTPFPRRETSGVKPNARALVVLAALLAALPAQAATTAVVPARSGDSVLYHYAVDGQPPAAGQLWIVRAAADKITITASSAEELPATFAFAVDARGTLRPTTDDAAAGSGALAGAMARALVAALDVVTAQPPDAASWTSDAVLPAEPALGMTAAITVHFTARAASAANGERAVIADGSALVPFVPPPPPQKVGAKPPPPQKPIPADYTMHLEAALRSGALASVHGQTAYTPQGNPTKPLVRYDWSIAGP
jgi:hypothetical protein